MNAPSEVDPQIKNQSKAAYYLLACIFLGTGIYFIAQGITQLFKL